MKKDADILNVVLILISLCLAFKLPFELFLFSYAVLGPLHYLTEINWLRDKNYFIHETKWIWFFVFLVAALTMAALLKMPAFSGIETIPAVHQTALFIRRSFSEIILTSFIFATGLITFTKRLHLILYLLVSFAVAYILLRFIPGAVLFTAIFFPTLVHVYVFTLLFMIYGTLGTKSTPGIIAIALLMLGPVIIALSNVDVAEHIIGNYTRESFDAIGFEVIHTNIARFLNPGNKSNFVFLSELGIKIQIFLAFAYTYHYLNWFSKTTVIGWHKSMSKSKIAIILILWLTCVGIYAYDYKTGVIALTFLSFSHVFVEFPLNIASIKGIWMKVRGNAS